MYMEHMFTRRKTADVSALSSYGSCKTENKRCGSCILTTKLVTRTNYYDIASVGFPLIIFVPPLHSSMELFLALL